MAEAGTFGKLAAANGYSFYVAEATELNNHFQRNERGHSPNTIGMHQNTLNNGGINSNAALRSICITTSLVVRQDNNSV